MLFLFLTWFQIMPVGELDNTLRSILPLVLPRVFNVLQAGPKKLRVRVELLRKQTVDKHLFKSGRGRKKTSDTFLIQT